MLNVWENKWYLIYSGKIACLATFDYEVLRPWPLTQWNAKGTSNTKYEFLCSIIKLLVHSARTRQKALNEHCDLEPYKLVSCVYGVNISAQFKIVRTRHPLTAVLHSEMWVCDRGHLCLTFDLLTSKLLFYLYAICKKGNITAWHLLGKSGGQTDDEAQCIRRRAVGGAHSDVLGLWLLLGNKRPAKAQHTRSVLHWIARLGLGYCL